MKKTVTVSIPVYNGEQFVLESLQSVVNQTVKVDQVIICDNLSNDNTIHIVEKFIKNHKDWNINLHINHKNIGFQNNFIKCYDLVKTDYLVILHVDDILKPDTIEKQVDFLKKNPEYAVVGGGVDVMDKTGIIKRHSQSKENLFFRTNQIYEFIKATASWIPFSSVMFNLKYSREVEYLTKESVGPEELYWPLLLQKHPIAILSTSLICIRSHDGQLHVNNSLNMFDKYVKHFSDKIEQAKLEKGNKRITKTEKTIKKQVSRMSIKIGKNIFKLKNNFKIAYKYYMYGIKQYPGIIFTKFFLKSLLK